jgi:hypothetical protein
VAGRVPVRGPGEFLVARLRPVGRAQPVARYRRRSAAQSALAGMNNDCAGHGVSGRGSRASDDLGLLDGFAQGSAGQQEVEEHPDAGWK